MTILVQFYVQLRDIVGVPETDIDVPPGSTVGDLLEQIYSQTPPLRVHDKTILIGAGVEFVDRNYKPTPDEELAIMPPVQADNKLSGQFTDRSGRVAATSSGGITARDLSWARRRTLPARSHRVRVGGKELDLYPCLHGATVRSRAGSVRIGRSRWFKICDTKKSCLSKLHFLFIAHCAH